MKAIKPRFAPCLSGGLRAGERAGVQRLTLHALLVLFCAFACGGIRGETLVVGTNQPVAINLSVPTNHALVIYGGQFNVWEPEVSWRLTQFGRPHLFRAEAMFDRILKTPVGRPNLLAGPLTVELAIPSEKLSPFDHGWLSYEILPLAGLRTLIIPPAVTNRVEVAPGTSFRLVSRNARLDLETSWQLVNADARTTLDADAVQRLFDMELSGPVEIEIGNASMQEPVWLTYVLHSGSIQTLPDGVITAVGANSFIVEESADLTHWTVGTVILKQAAPGRFYRLRISR